MEEKILELDIEPGMRDGYQYPFVAEGKCPLNWRDSIVHRSVVDPGEVLFIVIS